MSVRVEVHWNCDESGCYERASTPTLEPPEGWTYEEKFVRCPRCNLGKCPGHGSGRDLYGEWCPCVHPIHHNGPHECKHDVNG